MLLYLKLLQDYVTYLLKEGALSAGLKALVKEGRIERAQQSQLGKCRPFQ